MLLLRSGAQRLALHVDELVGSRESAVDMGWRLAGGPKALLKAIQTG